MTTQKRVFARFHPQVEVGDNVRDIDIPGNEPYDVTDDVTDDMVSFDYSSDELQYAQNAPQWVQDWEGPFGVEIIGREAREAPAPGFDWARASAALKTVPDGKLARNFATCADCDRYRKALHRIHRGDAFPHKIAAAALNGDDE